MEFVNQDLKFPISIAPMMEWTDRHYRYLMRLFTKKTVLYTEMVTAEAILRGDRDKLLGKNMDNPVVLQLGGSDPEKIHRASQASLEFGYDALNLNVGCPSDRVSDGQFGACLMANPNLVAENCLAMKEGSSLPISVKHRIGINGKESYEDLRNFIHIVHTQGNVNHFIVHARIAILGGLSPSENRTIPPLRYEDVYRLKKDFPELRIEINGGIVNWLQALEFLQNGLDGVMIGRAAYENPALFAMVDRLFDDSGNIRSKFQEVISEIEPHRVIDWKLVRNSIEEYLEKVLFEGGKVHHVLRHCMGFFHSVNGGRKYRRYLSENMHNHPSDSRLFSKAMESIQL